MKYVQAVQTSDGKLHPCDRTAGLHAHQRYDAAMTQLRHHLTVHMGSVKEAYTAAVWIENNFSTIANCAALLADTKLEQWEDE